MGIASGESRRRQMAERGDAREEPERTPAGTVIARVDAWAGDTLRRYVVRQGRRKNQITIECAGKRIDGHGWDWFFRQLRRNLAGLTR